MAIKLSGSTVINDNRQIENAGPIGIGTTVGSVNVDLSIVTAKDHPLFMHSTDSGASVVLSDSTSAWKYSLSDNTFKIRTNGQSGAHDATGSAVRLVLDQYGKLGLGIGNINPTTELDVGGDVYVSSKLGIGTVNNTGSEALMIAAGADGTGINLYPATGTVYTRFTFDAHRTGTGQAVGQIQWHNNNSVLSEVRCITDLSGNDKGRIDFRNNGSTMFSVNASNHLMFRGNNGTFIDGGYNNEMGFVVNSIPSLWVTYNGSSPRVGVGSTSTSHPFTVYSDEATLFKGIRPGVNAGIALESSGGNICFGSNTDGDAVISTSSDLSAAGFMLKSDRSTGDLTIGGNLVVTAGNGIDFSATDDGSGGSNVGEVFDDYEEGDWTPGFYDSVSGGTSATGTDIAGTYTRIGRLVTLSITVTNLTTTGKSGTFYIRDLPYTVKSLTGNQRWTAAVDYSRIDNTAGGGGGTLVATIVDSTDYIRLTDNKSDGDNNNDMVQWSELSDGATDVRFSITYMQG